MRRVKRKVIEEMDEVEVIGDRTRGGIGKIKKYIEEEYEKDKDERRKCDTARLDKVKRIQNKSRKTNKGEKVKNQTRQ